VPFELGRALLIAEAVTPAALSRALYAAATQGVPLARALGALDAITMERLEEELARADAPVVHHVVPVAELLDALPTGLCSRLLAIPIRRDPRTGTIDVAVADARDPHPAREIGYLLKAPVRVVRAPLAALEAAIARTFTKPLTRHATLTPPRWKREPPEPVLPMRASTTPIWGTPMPLRSIPPPAKLPSVLPIPLTRRSLTGDSEPSLDRHLGADLRPRGRGTAQGHAPPPPPDEPIDGRTIPAPPPSSMPPSAPSVPPPAAGRAASVPPPAPPARPSQRATHGVIHPDADGGRIPGLPFADASAVIAAMRIASTRDEVLEMLQAGVRAVARKVALMVVRRDGFVGWSCTPEFGDMGRLRLVRIPVTLPGALSSASMGTTYLGPLYKSRAHEPLLAVMEHASADVAVVGVRVSGHPAVVVVADDLGDTALGTQRMEALARAAGESLTRIVRRIR